MNIDENDFRRRYAELSDEALLSIPRGELVELARECYDQELARRGLRSIEETEEIAVEPPGVADEFVPAATFFSRMKLKSLADYWALATSFVTWRMSTRWQRCGRGAALSAGCG
jgi:hypothetical protein